MEVPRNYKIVSPKRKDIISSPGFKLKSFGLQRPFPACLINSDNELIHRQTLTVGACMLREKGLAILFFDDPKTHQRLRKGSRFVLAEIRHKLSQIIAQELVLFSGLFFSMKDLKKDPLIQPGRVNIPQGLSHRKTRLIPINEIRSMQCYAFKEGKSTYTIISILWEKNETQIEPILIYTEDKKILKMHKYLPYLYFLNRWSYELGMARTQYMHNALGRDFKLLWAQFNHKIKALRGQRRMKKEIGKLQREFAASFDQYLKEAGISPEEIKQAGLENTRYWMQHVKDEIGFENMPRVYGIES
jgi:hypothetical protein